MAKKIAKKSEAKSGSHQVSQSLKNKIEFVEIRLLSPYSKNARVHADHQVVEIAASIQEFGWTNPILVDNAFQIMAGHGRYLAAKLLELKKVPVIKLGYLSDAQKRAYTIADNKLALKADWDFSMLTKELQEIEALGMDLTHTGFDQRELEAMIISLNEKEVKNSNSELDLSSFSGFSHTCPKCNFQWNENGPTKE